MIHRIALPLAACLTLLPILSAAQELKSEVSATPPPATETAPLPAAPAPAPAPAEPPRRKPRRKSPAPAKERKKGPQESPSAKYKTRLLTENTETTYRFDAYGNPIKPGVKKTLPPNGVGTPHVEAATPGSGRKACSAAEPCAGKSSDPEAL